MRAEVGAVIALVIVWVLLLRTNLLLEDIRDELRAIRSEGKEDNERARDKAGSGRTVWWAARR